MNTQVAVLGGGCFWCVEAVFNDLKGVLKAESGYAGGHVTNPTYEQVCDGRTGHAEVVRVEFDADELPFRDLLGVFFAIHDPTTPDRQGNDVGPQYRSAVFHYTDAQCDLAEAVIAKLNAAQIWPNPIVTYHHSASFGMNGFVLCIVISWMQYAASAFIPSVRNRPI